MSRPINPYALAFEGLVYILFIGCLWRAGKQGQSGLVELLSAGCYGFLVEWLTIKQLHAYSYGQFMVIIDGAPVCIALGWALVIYANMEFSSRIDLPEPARPILDALLALNVDMALDTTAIRLGLWAWNGIGLKDQWFGVPWVNFWAWFIVVWSFSGFVRALRPWQRHHIYRWLYAPFAAALSLLILIAMSEVYRLLSANLGADALGVAVLIAGSVAIVLDFHPRIVRAELPEPLTVTVPIAFHAFAAIAGLMAGIFANQPILGVIGLITLTVSVVVHLLPWWISRTRPYVMET